MVTETPDAIHVVTDSLEATVNKRGYVSGVAGGSLVDRKTGFRDPGFGLDIADFILEPGSDAAHRTQLAPDLTYDFGNLVHGGRAKRIVEGPQICTRAGELQPQVIRGGDFVAIRQAFTYTLAPPGKRAGSRWEQTLVFPAGKRYFLCSDRVTSANSYESPSLRVDMPGHVKHAGGDKFGEVYLSYRGRIPAAEFSADFAPDTKYDYVRGRDPMPRRFIRAIHLRDPATRADGPWLAGMSLEPKVVSEAWCHQRGYVCMIEEVGGRPVKPGGTFGAAYIVGYFDSVPEMERVYDRYANHESLQADELEWRLMK